ncbi:MAG: LacI family DNA-binding transcriptional regulator [Flavobacteriaceae bacterium]|nr:LacI family DNA-binding transcriptional regulator [Flavobacteriaceae bacterium]
MGTKITLKKIAKELGVSTSTVSKALSDSHEISQDTRDKVKAFAKLYHYKPNSLALRLRNQRSMVIGVIIPEIVHHFFSTVISGIEHGANTRGYNVMVCFSNDSYQKEVLNIEMLAGGSVDGFLVSIANETQELADFRHFEDLKEEVPLVLFDRVHPFINCDKVVVDDFGGGYKATEYLIKTGCNKVAIITTPDHISVGLSRKKGYLKALEDYNIDINPDYIIKIDEKKDIKEQIKMLIDLPVRPDGIFAVNEIYAATAMKIAQEKGLIIPEEISFIGFTDGYISQFSNPSMSTLAQHGHEMGEKAIALLINRIESKEQDYPFKTEIINVDLKIRNSTKKIT